ncbi:hypothetical protein R1sor_016785 [Riccia sorocarpa]|uniref:Uncharacterized protein n=1 Tax=Riccia sorocarpa TaxID=122646 RepID=A0ABD3HK59_9MARC
MKAIKVESTNRKGITEGPIKQSHKKSDRKRVFSSSSVSALKSRHITGIKDRGKRRLASSSRAEDNHDVLGRRRLLEWRTADFDPIRNAPSDDVPESKHRRHEYKRVQKLSFLAAANKASSFSTISYTQTAFAGTLLMRLLSILGSHQLITALTRQCKVPRTSDKLGLTQTVKLFQSWKRAVPGGFTRSAFSKDQVRENWEELLREYVSSRPHLKRVCLLVDTKWRLKPRDQQLENARTCYHIILTFRPTFFHLWTSHMMVSSRSGAGLSHLRASLAGVVSGESHKSPLHCVSSCICL